MHSCEELFTSPSEMWALLSSSDPQVWDQLRGRSLVTHPPLSSCLLSRSIFHNLNHQSCRCCWKRFWSTVQLQKDLLNHPFVLLSPGLILWSAVIWTVQPGPVHQDRFCLSGIRLLPGMSLFIYSYEVCGKAGPQHDAAASNHTVLLEFCRVTLISSDQMKFLRMFCPEL